MDPGNLGSIDFETGQRRTENQKYTPSIHYRTAMYLNKKNKRQLLIRSNGETS
ncbi:MAG: hypothetical protein XD88_0704 [Methanocalculus sp. 52_23]|nr:MAG: hypothetical protein XD88_0704 [Methanocalculus sp. 52_23]